MQALERTFAYDDQAVRVVMIDGEPWWVASDVASILGYRDGYSAARMLPADEKGTHSVSTLGGPQGVTIVSESGLYRLVLRSERPEAERFRRWVTHEVLPQIRRTGSYGGALNLRDPKQLAPLALQLARAREEHPPPARLGRGCRAPRPARGRPRNVGSGQPARPPAWLAGASPSPARGPAVRFDEVSP